MTDPAYLKAVLDWRNEREESIRKENGWLALAGLFWLNPGWNQIGSDPTCEIRLPDRAPAHLGAFNYSVESVTFHVNGAINVQINHKRATTAILKPDITDDPDFITLDDLRLVVIQRGDRLGIRLWDNRRKERYLFPARTWYAIDEAFRLSARYYPYERPKTVHFPDVTGELTKIPVDGFVAFEFGGQTNRLDVSKEEDQSLFIRFRDKTSESRTYPTGRYLIAKVDNEDKVALDFNYSYNPPCAFTKFATCVFAPDQNRLNFSIEAGETYLRGNPTTH